MARYLLQPAARDDIKDIYRYIADRNRTAAAKVRAQILSTFRMLAESPFLGEARDDLAAGLRIFTTGNYVIIYRPKPGGIEIVQVVHGARDWEAAFGRSNN